MSGSRTEAAPGGVLLDFFYGLRGRGLAVTPTQWLTVIGALARGLHGASLTGFYSLSRAILVRDESELDGFDLAFAECFGGVSGLSGEIEKRLLAEIDERVFEWLASPIPPRPVDPAWAGALEKVDVEALRAELERRLAGQRERHDGGDRWVGTGGTSPFGHFGYHPGGIRVGGGRRLGSAVQVAAGRRYREHRRDRVLDTRQLSVALRKLRALSRRGAADQLDLEATIDATARDAGELKLVFCPPRVNDLELLLALDVGGSMEPYRRLVDALFSAAHAARHFKRFEHVYFHNCVYERVYADSWFEEPIRLDDLFRSLSPRTRLVLVGDAHMYPGELTRRWGAIHWWERNEEPGLEYLRRLAERFPAAAWINPRPERSWNAPSIRLVREVFPMYPLTVEGVERLADDLAGRDR
jgi:uncharacterized protein